MSPPQRVEDAIPCEVEARPRLLLDSLNGTLLALPSSPPVRLQLGQASFTQAMAHLAPRLDKPLRPLLPPFLLLSWAPPLSEAEGAALLDDYKAWCSLRPGASGCVSFPRHSGLYLDEEDRLLMALDSAV